MIGFLAPPWLLAALAVAVPLAIHLLRRRIGARIEFPAVQWLERAEREHSRSLRLRNLLLLLLRAGAILCLALAAARPVARLPGPGHAPTALAIVLDNSLSTSAVSGGRPVLDDLKARALAAASRAGGDDQLWLVAADGAVTGGSPAAVRRAIAQVTAYGGAGDPPAAVLRAASLVRASPLAARELAILTDAQATAWPDPLALGELHVTIYRPAGDPPADRAVIDARAEPARWTPRGAVHARVRAADSAAYRITLAGRTLARGIAGRDGDVYVPSSPAERGWQEGTVELEPDEYRGDDIRHFAVWIGAPPAVRVDSSAGLFARTAVASLVQSGRVANGADIAVVAADQATRLPAVLIAPADPVRAGAADRALERLGVPWRFGEMRRGATPVSGFPGVVETRRFALTRATSARADTLAMAGGDAWIVRGPGYVLIASPLLPDATNFPLRAAFVPWLADALTQDLATNGRAILAAPGAHLVHEGDSIVAPSKAGVYWFTSGGARAGALVVDPEPSESELARLDLATLRERITGRDVVAVADSAAFATAAFTAAARRPIGSWFLALAFILLAAESFGAARGARR